MSYSDRAARLVQDGGKAFEAGELIKSKLDRVIKRLTEASEYAKATGRLSPDEQYAVRILRSRQRLIDREWLAQFGQGRPMENAKIELSLKSQDDGMLLKFGEKLHARGRFSCKACAAYVDEITLIPLPLNRLCKICKSGIEHTRDTQEIVPIEGPIDIEGIVPASDPDKTMPEGCRGPKKIGQEPRKIIYTRYFLCDYCFHSEEVVL